MAADDRDAVADHLAFKLWEPDALTAVEFYERLTAAYRGDHGVWAAVNLPPEEMHEPVCRSRVDSAAPRSSCSRARSTTRTWGRGPRDSGDGPVRDAE